MSTFFTADTHLQHRNIIKYCGRPFVDEHEQDETIVSNWNSRVTDRDWVYHIGDVGMGSLGPILSRLRGHKVLIVGSHDKFLKDEAARKCFEQIHYGFYQLKLDGQHVVLCHYCMQSWPRSFHGSWHLYGHSHGRIQETETMLRFDVGVDVWDFQLVSWDMVKMKMSLKRREDHYDIEEADKYVVENREANRLLLGGA